MNSSRNTAASRGRHACRSWNRRWTGPGSSLVYAETVPTLPQLAAALGFGLAKGHCFPDGNRRIALASMDVFLQLNGFELKATEEEAVVVILAISSGELDDAGLAEWISASVAPPADEPG